MRLPNTLIKTQWQLWTPELDATTTRQDSPSKIGLAIKSAFNKACDGPGWNPETVQLGGYMRALDYCSHPGPEAKLHSYNTAIITDHPFLAYLEGLKFVPKAVKHIYRADTRLKYLRATECWDFFGDMNRAQSAWTIYLKNVPLTQEPTP